MPIKTCKKNHPEISFAYGYTIGDDKCPLCAAIKDEELTTKEKERIKHKLEVLRNSCLEGLDGTWDCSTTEGKEAFEPMAESCKKIADILGIELNPYESTEDEVA